MSFNKDVEKQIIQLEKSVVDLDLDLDFTLPGYPHIELKKNGKDILVNLENLEEYLNVQKFFSNLTLNIEFDFFNYILF